MNELKEYKLNFALDTIPADKDSKDEIIYNLIGEFANDSNSSMFREDVTKYMVGLEPSVSKKGYDDDYRPIEVKPLNYKGVQINKKGKKTNKRLNGAGTFTDMTWKRDLKYSNDGCTMLVSGFYFGKLVYIVEFKYDKIRHRVKHMLEMHLPDGDIKGKYVRTTTFGWGDWKDDFKLKFLSPKIEEYKDGIVKGLYQLLTTTPIDSTPV